MTHSPSIEISDYGPYFELTSLSQMCTLPQFNHALHMLLLFQLVSFAQFNLVTYPCINMGLTSLTFPLTFLPDSRKWQECQNHLLVGWWLNLIIKQQVWCTNVKMLITDEGKCHITVSICISCLCVSIQMWCTFCSRRATFLWSLRVVWAFPEFKAWDKLLSSTESETIFQIWLEACVENNSICSWIKFSYSFSSRPHCSQNGFWYFAQITCWLFLCSPTMKRYTLSLA